MLSDLTIVNTIASVAASTILHPFETTIVRRTAREQRSGVASKVEPTDRVREEQTRLEHTLERRRVEAKQSRLEETVKRQRQEEERKQGKKHPKRAAEKERNRSGDQKARIGANEEGKRRADQQQSVEEKKTGGYLPKDFEFPKLWGLHNTGQTVNGVDGAHDSLEAATNLIAVPPLFKLVFLSILGTTILSGVGAVGIAFAYENELGGNQQSVFEAANTTWKMGVGAIFGLLGGKAT